MSVGEFAVLDEDAVRERCPPAAATRAILDALRSGLDPGADVPRMPVPVEHGQLLLMPSAATEALDLPGADHVGVKVASVAPANPSIGRPRIQGAYLLFDRRTLAPVAVIDGAALTTLRTPAVSVAAISPFLERRSLPLSIAVVGSGPQARGHVDALRSWLPDGGVGRVDHLVRDVDAVDRSLLDPRSGVELLGTTGAQQRLSTADVVVCATSARRALFDSAVLADETVVVAVGSHEPDAREVDAALCRRATVVVEDAATALREAGDVVMAIDEGALAASDLVAMRAAVDGSADVPADRPVLFKSVGMSWEDLVVASAIVAGG